MTPALQTPGDQPLSHASSALEIAISYGESMLDVKHLVGQRSFVIGEGKAADLSVSSDELPASEFPLVRWIDGHYVLTFIGEQRGEVEHEGVFRPLQWLRQQAQADDQLPGCFRYVLPLDSRATLRFGGLTITLRYVSPPDKVDDTRGFRELRYSTLLLTFSSVFVVAILVGLLSSFKPELAEMRVPELLRAARFFGQAEPVSATRVGNVVLDTSPLVTGLDAKAAAAVIAAEAQSLSNCTATLATGSGVRATLVTNAEGRVERVETEALNRLQTDEGLRCVEDTLRALRFSGDGRIVYTLGVSR